MSTDAGIAGSNVAGEGPVECWCCGSRDVPERMVHLGNHPEVHLCPRCAHFVHQQAWQIEDRTRRGLGVLTRDRVRQMRAEVMRRGWHENRIIGGPLRWLGRHLP